MMKQLLLISYMCFGSVFLQGQHHGCTFDDNLLLTNTTTIRTRGGFEHTNPLFNWAPNPWSKKAEVEYFFDRRVYESDRALIQTEMRRIARKVPCIKFIEKNEATVKAHHLEIQVGDVDCRRGFSGGVNIKYTEYYNAYDTWREYDEKLILNSKYRLANRPSCARDQNIKGSILHELMHVLGIAHTQKRHDRDLYINYHKECVDPAGVEQYEKFSEADLNTFKLPYQCNSIMHYRPDTYGNGHCKTMTATDPQHCKQIGSNTPTKEDWMMLKKAHCKRK